MNDFKPGDRVTSNAGGYYMGIPATIINKAQVQHGNFTCYILELDTGKRIELESRDIKRIINEPITELEKEWRETFDKWQE